MKLNINPTLCVFLLAASPNGLRAAEYVNAKFTPKEHAIRKVLLLPAQIQLTKSGMKGSEGMAKESEEMAGQIMAVVIKHLEARKVTVLANPFTEEALKSNEEMRSAVMKVQAKYDTVSAQLHSKPKEVRAGRYTLGDEVSTLGPAAEADAIVFIRGNGTVLTGGKRLFGALVTGASADTIHTYVTFADAKSGEVLAIVNILKAGDLESRKLMSKTLTKSFKKIPFSTD